MTEEGIPEDICDFIARCIGSIEQLEILLYLSEEAGGGDRSVAEIFKEFQSSPASVRQRLTELRESGLLVELDEERYRYEPKSAELKELVGRLALNYRERRVKVIEAIYKSAADGKDISL